MILPSVSSLVPQPWEENWSNADTFAPSATLVPSGASTLHLHELDARDGAVGGLEERQAELGHVQAHVARVLLADVDHDAAVQRRRRQVDPLRAPQSDGSSRPISKLAGALQSDASPLPSHTRTCHETVSRERQRRAGVGRLRRGAVDRPGVPAWPSRGHATS
jgi:hypothetical protein